MSDRPVTAQPWALATRSSRAANALHDRHYSRRASSVGSGSVAGPYRSLVLVTPDAQALWVSVAPQFVRDAWRGAWRCAVFRREGGHCWPQTSSGAPSRRP